MLNSTGIFIIVHLLFVSSIYSQSKPGWSSWSSEQNIRAFAFSGKTCWTAVRGLGLLRLDQQMNGYVLFNNLNSPLPSNLITCLAVGSDGTIWIGTEEGLASFDGREWNIFTRENSPFTTHSITSVDIDDSLRVWVASQDGLHCFDKGLWTDVLESFPGFPVDILSGIRKIECIGTQVWIRTPHSVCRFSGKDWKSWKITTEMFGSSDDHVVSSTGTLWIQSSSDSTLLGISDDEYSTYPHPHYGPGGRLLIDSHDVKWYIIQRKLYRESSNGWQFVASLPAQVDRYIYPVGVDDSSHIWICQSESDIIHKYNPALDQWENITIPNGSKPQNKMDQILIDSDEKLWGLWNRTLFLRNGENWVEIIPVENGGSVDVYRIASDKNGNLKAAGWNYSSSALFTSVKASGIWPNWNATEFSTRVRLGAISYSTQSSSWISFMQDYNSKPFQFISFSENGISVLPSDSQLTHLAQIEVTPDGTIWALTIERESLYMLKDSTWKQIYLEGQNDSILSIVAGGGDTLWAGVDGIGLGMFDGSEWHLFDSTIIGYNHVKPLYYDSRKGELWSLVFITKQIVSFFGNYISEFPVGVLRFAGHEATLLSPVNSGLIDSKVHSISSDENCIYFASEHGISYLHYASSPVTKELNSSAINKPRQMLCAKVFGGKPLQINLRASGEVSISLFDLSGKLIEHRKLGRLRQGKSIISINRPKGIFLARVEVKE